MYREKILVSVILLSILMFACKDDGNDFGDYIEGTYTDSISLNTEENPIVIVFEQLQLLDQMEEQIPNAIIDDKLPEDSIKISLNVSYGSYNSQPNVFKDLSIISDTVFIWYSTRSKGNDILDKSESINSINTSPKITYVEVDSITIYKNSMKQITLLTKLYQ